MHYTKKVPIPNAPGKITFKKKGGSVYVLYEYDRVYNKEKRYNVPKRVVIGTRCPDDEGYMIPNDSYYRYFNVTPPEVRESAERSSLVEAGAFAVIEEVANGYGLPETLGRHFGKDAGLVLDLASFSIITEDNAAQHYPAYASRHPLFSEGMRIASDEKICRFLKSVTPDMRLGFLRDWNEKRNKAGRIYISYDSTNKNCQAGDIDFAEFGKPKCDNGKEIVNLSVAYDETNSVPLFYEEYPGSINDMAQFRSFVDRLDGMGYKHIGLVLDRGYFSEDNIAYADRMGYSLVIMMKGCKKIAASAVDELYGTFETDRKCSIPEYFLYGKTVKRRIFASDGKDRYVHAYFSPEKMASERRCLESRLKMLSAFLEKQLGATFNPTGEMESLYDLAYNKKGELVAFSENDKAIGERLRRCGYFCIVTTESMDARDALLLYKGRDASEKLFSADKSFLGSRTMRVQGAESTDTKFFIEFIALIIRSRMYSLIKELSVRTGKRLNYYNVPSLVEELDKIELIRLTDGRYRLDHAITRTQRLLLSAFGISEDDAKKSLERYSSILSDEAGTGKKEEEDYDGEEEKPFFD
ncbi:MAG: transposase [Candidatus Cryptobacteroides sp.]